MYHINDTHAWQGRLTKPETLQAKVHADRLAQELAASTLPFIDMPYYAELVQELSADTPLLRSFKHMVLLGIGGSALGAKALQKAFFPEQDRPGHTGPWLWVLDNVDAGSLRAVLTNLPPEETIVFVVSKSGGTVETLAQYVLTKEWLQKSLGSAWTKHVRVATGHNEGFLYAEAVREGLRVYQIPQHLGGRYSVLSAVGLVPCAFLGLAWTDFLDGARNLTAPLLNSKDTAKMLADHSAFRMATWAYSLLQAQYSQLIFFMYVPQWASFGPWFAQLWAESLGKEGKGSMPLPSVGVTDQHSTCQMFLEGPADKGCLVLSCAQHDDGLCLPKGLPSHLHFLEGQPLEALLAAERLGTSAALVQHNVPLMELSFTEINPYNAGALMQFCMLATLFTGWLLDINPLDQPAVELGKRLAYARLGSTAYPEEAALLERFLGQNTV